MERNVLARLQYQSKWEYLPIDSNGEVIWKVPLCQWSFFFIAIGLWINVLVGYIQLPDFAGKDYENYFTSPFTGKENADIATKVNIALDSMQNTVMPFRNQVDSLCDNLQLYFNM